MTPTIALIAVSLIAAGLCVAVGIMQWRIDQLKAQNDRERARHEVTNELLTEARNEAKNEYDLRRQAERNLAEANDEVDTWRARAMRAEKKAAELESTCDDLFDTLCKAVEKLPVPFHLRKRDENGRFVKVSAFEVATALHGEMAEANRKRALDKAMQAVSDEAAKCIDVIKDVKTNAQEASEALDKFSTLVSETTRPKPHTLRHGMTVKDPTLEQAKEIFDEAKRLGIQFDDNKSPHTVHIWFCHTAFNGPEICYRVNEIEWDDKTETFITPSQFISHMRGEDVETLCEEIRHNANEGI